MTPEEYDKAPSQKEIVSAERGNSYGDFSKIAADAQTLKCMLVTAQMTVVQREAMQMICTKLARLANGDPNHIDSWFDIAGYADLVVNDIQTPKEGEALPPGSWILKVPHGR